VKTLRRTSVATILSLILTVSALAGDIHCPGAVSTGTATAETTDVTTAVILAVISLVL
jgi:hypothetical protein